MFLLNGQNLLFALCADLHQQTFTSCCVLFKLGLFVRPALFGSDHLRHEPSVTGNLYREMSRPNDFPRECHLLHLVNRSEFEF